jgi:hypothetical protein
MANARGFTAVEPKLLGEAISRGPEPVRPPKDPRIGREAATTVAHAESAAPPRALSTATYAK